MRTLFWGAYSWLLIYLPITERKERALWGPFDRGTIPIHEAPPSPPHHLPKASPSKTIKFGVRISINMNLGKEDINLQSLHKIRRRKELIKIKEEIREQEDRRRTEKVNETKN